MSGRPQFDESIVIAAAIDVFKQRGFAAASISDLTEATGLSRSSLYQRFGDKDGLFREVLAAYTERVLQRMNSAQSGTARGRMEATLHAFISDGSSKIAGCLIARSCSEIPELSDGGTAAARKGASIQREFLANIVRQGIATGELAKDTDVDAMAWHYLGVLQAVSNFPKAGAGEAVIKRMIDVAMLAWPAPATN
ncbi:MAG: TetR/AcrR family transcriptional regulator [Bradyrhizobium sp.]|nr:TetR/AcrR family transcriptional regulator [Bradyrhizobium sp.]